MAALLPYTLIDYNGVYPEPLDWFTGEFRRPAMLNARNMVIGLGTDLVETARIQDSIRRFGDRFLTRVFTEDERAYCADKANSVPHYAARFAAKEACAKALGTGIAAGLRWLDMELCRDESGKPQMTLTGRAREQAAQLAVVTIYVSITHTKDYASATVLLEG